VDIKYRPDIDGLRAVAIFLVLMFHAFPNLVPGGFIGVDVFFVISGYLITSIIFDASSKGAFSFKEFYISRIIRLLPALLFVIATFLCIGYFYFLPNQFNQFNQYVISTLLSFSNLLSYHESGYFDTLSLHKPLLHTWSLGVEEQFYFFWPLTLVFLLKNNCFNKGLLAIIFTSFLLNIVYIQTDPVGAFFLPYTRYWELLFGALTYRASTVFKKMQNMYLAQFISVSALVIILICALKINSELHFPGYWALIPVLATSALLFFSYSSINKVFLSSQPMVFVGLISYPLYLWHWPLLVFFRMVGQSSTKTTLVVIIISFVLSTITYLYLEKPIRKTYKYNHKNFLLFILGLVFLILMLVSGGFFLDKTKKSRIDANYERVVSQFSLPWMVQADCLKANPFITDGFCIATGMPDKVEAVIFGDSFAHAISNGFLNPFEPDMKVKSILGVGRAGCLPYLGIEEVGNIGVHKDCQLQLQGMVDYIKHTDSVKTVYLIGRHPARVGLVGGFGPGEPALWNMHYEFMGQHINPDQAFVNGLGSTIDTLQKMGKKVVFVHSPPELDFEPDTCLKFDLVKGRRLDDCRIPRAAVEKRQQGYRVLFTKVLAKHHEIEVFDPMNYLCDQSFCYAQKNGYMLYRDHSHLSADGASFILEKMGLVNNTQIAKSIK